MGWTMLEIFLRVQIQNKTIRQKITIDNISHRISKQKRQWVGHGCHCLFLLKYVYVILRGDYESASEWGTLRLGGEMIFAG